MVSARLAAFAHATPPRQGSKARRPAAARNARRAPQCRAGPRSGGRCLREQRGGPWAAPAAARAFVCECRRGADSSRFNSCHIICTGCKQPSPSPPRHRVKSRLTIPSSRSNQQQQHCVLPSLLYHQLLQLVYSKQGTPSTRLPRPGARNVLVPGGWSGGASLLRGNSAGRGMGCSANPMPAGSRALRGSPPPRGEGFADRTLARRNALSEAELRSRFGFWKGRGGTPQ